MEETIDDLRHADVEENPRKTFLEGMAHADLVDRVMMLEEHNDRLKELCVKSAENNQKAIAALQARADNKSPIIGVH